MANMPQTVYRFIWQFVCQQKWAFLFLSIFYCAWALNQVALPYSFELLFDAMAPFQEVPFSWAMLTVPLLYGLSMWLLIEIGYRSYDFLAARTLPVFEASVRMFMFEKLQRHSYQFFGQEFVGSLANKIGDMPRSAARMVQMCLTLFIPTFIAFVIACFMFMSKHPLFGVIIVFWGALHIGISMMTAHLCYQKSHNHAEARSRLLGGIVDSLTNHMSVRLFARHRHEKDYIASWQAYEKNLNKEVLTDIAKIRLLQGVFSFLINGVLLTWFTLYSFQQGTITFGEIIYILPAAWNITAMAWLAGIELPFFFREKGVCEQGMKLLKTPYELPAREEDKVLNVTKGEITFDHVSFNYHGNPVLFDKKNIVIKPGSKIGLVGPSGSGKTTFAKLILRLFDAVEGSIQIDGQDIKQVTLESLRKHIAMIPQSPLLFHRSIMENIRYGDLAASNAQVIEVARKAHCHEFIETLPEQYDTIVGDQGMRLSHGQKQLIIIARAMLKNAPILILDEATSSLDTVTESHIQDSIHQIIEDRTTLVIAHRLSTIMDMDRILVFEDGHIVEDGTHAELLKKKGTYAALWKQQVGGFI